MSRLIPTMRRLAGVAIAMALVGVLGAAAPPPLSNPKSSGVSTAKIVPPPVDTSLPSPPSVQPADLPEAALLARSLPWDIIPRDEAWAKLMAAPAQKHQAARWTMALAYIGEGWGPEALGMLDQMAREDRGLDQVANYRLARGQALVIMARYPEAIAALSFPLLAEQPDACAWRLRALVAAGKPAEALQQARCAVSALSRLPEPARAPFLRAMGRAGVGGGQPQFALDWLAHLPEDDAEARLIRAEALLALGKVKEGNEALAIAARSSVEPLAVEAEWVRIRDGLKTGAIEPQAALSALDQLIFRWRGGPIEKAALQLAHNVASQQGDIVRALATGATLVRHFAIALEDSEFLTRYRAMLARLLDPDTAKALPIETAAGLYWDYRDLAPVGAEGDLLASRLSSRLEAAGLHARAGELLEHQLLVRAADEAKGPLSVKVANLFLQAGLPDRALDALRRSARAVYPRDVLYDRHRIEAVALTRVGRGEEALALLDGVPNSQGLTAEILWRLEDWQRLAELQQPMIAAHKSGPAALPMQVLLLRQAIALSILGDDAGLNTLRDRHGSAFVGQPAQPAFALLTATVEAPAPDALSKAMASMPSISPAGAYANLMGTAPLTPAASPAQRAAMPNGARPAVAPAKTATPTPIVPAGQAKNSGKA